MFNSYGVHRILSSIASIERASSNKPVEDTTKNSQPQLIPTKPKEPKLWIKIKHLPQIARANMTALPTKHAILHKKNISIAHSIKSEAMSYFLNSPLMNIRNKKPLEAAYSLDQNEKRNKLHSSQHQRVTKFSRSFKKNSVQWELRKNNSLLQANTIEKTDGFNTQVLSLKANRFDMYICKLTQKKGLNLFSNILSTVKKDNTNLLVYL